MEKSAFSCHPASIVAKNLQNNLEQSEFKKREALFLFCKVTSGSNDGSSVTFLA